MIRPLSSCPSRQSDIDLDVEPHQWKLVVKCEGESVPVTCEWVEGELEVEVEGRGEKVTLATDWSLGDSVMMADVDGKEVVVQVRAECMCSMYMKIHVYSTPAGSVVKEEKKENPDPIHHTKTIQTRKHTMTLGHLGAKP